MTVLILSEMGRRRDERAQEEFEFGAVAARCPDCGTQDTEAGVLTAARRCCRCGTWWSPRVWAAGGIGLRLVVPALETEVVREA